MRLGLTVKGILLGCVFALAAAQAQATEFHGQVTFGGLPVPGAQAVVTATQGDKTVSAVTDDQGLFVFPDLADGAWTINITMTGFAPIKEPITVAPNAPTPVFELKIETLDQIRAEDKPVKVEPGTAPAVAAATAPEASGGNSSGSANGSAAGGKKPAQQAANNNAPQPPAQEASSASQSPDGFLINGSVNNAATSQFSLAQGFGNARNSHSLYSYQLLLKLDSSTLDANNWHPVGGFSSPKVPYTNFTLGGQVSGPLKIPHLLPAYRAPTFYIGYQRVQNSSVVTTPALVPTTTGPTPETAGYLGALADGNTIYAPTSGLMPGCTLTPGAPLPTYSQGQYIPTSCISPVATALLKYYPAPNLSGSTQYNYQASLSSPLTQDSGQVQLQKSIGTKDNIRGVYGMTSSRGSTPSIFVTDPQGDHFVDTQNNLGQNLSINWYHRLTQRLSGNLTYNPSRQRNHTNIAFENRQNVSQSVGINDNLQDPADYGPPSLIFAQSQIAGLSDGNSLNNRIQTQAIGVNMQWNRFRHEMQFGGDFRRQEWNYFQQANPRGTLAFTGLNVGTGSDYADFLLGLPDTSQIAYGNADKYLRESVYDLFAVDNFRVSPELTMNVALRWDYAAPITEIKNRLTNLDIGAGFTAETPVLATSPTGTQSGQHYPTSLVRPDKVGFEPQVGIAWRPISGSSLLVRAGYGLRQDPSAYQQTALAMANQTPCPDLSGPCTAPWSVTSLSLPYSSSCSFTIANPFQALPCSTSTPDTFAIDPNFRVGYAQAWNLSLQRDLPAALQLLVTYAGIKGTHGVQEILPNTYPVGGTAPSCTVSPCTGYFYRMSNGNSTREAGEVNLRRRLRAGFLASADYTYSKSLDDDYSYGGGQAVASNGSAQVAQDWRHPEAQRGLSTFDQRHLLKLQLQYTTGVGLGGHTLLSGWRGAIYKEWTVLANINVGSGLPETPTYFAAMPGTAFTGIIRGNYNGGRIHQLGTTASGIPTYLNPAAFTAPAPGQFGTAARDSITGPSQFSLNGSMQRGFRFHDRYNLTAQIDANNVLNHVTLASWSTAVGSTQFGTAQTANPMRSVIITLRMRY